MMVSRHVSRLAAIGLLVALLWVGWFACAAPILAGIADDRAEIARLTILRDRYVELAATIPELKQHLQALAQNGSQTAFLQGDNPAVLSAGMEGTVERLLTAAGASLHSSRTLPKENEEGFDRFSIDLELTASVVALQRLLYSLEIAAPLVVVDKLVVRLPENGAVSTGADGQPVHTVQLRLTSYARPAARPRS